MVMTVKAFSHGLTGRCWKNPHTHILTYITFFEASILKNLMTSLVGIRIPSPVKMEWIKLISSLQCNVQLENLGSWHSYGWYFDTYRPHKNIAVLTPSGKMNPTTLARLWCGLQTPLIPIWSIIWKMLWNEPDTQRPRGLDANFPVPDTTRHPQRHND